MRRIVSPRGCALAIAVSLLTACSDGGHGSSSSNACAEAVPAMLLECVTDANAAWQACLGVDGAPCAADDADLTAALDQLEDGIRGTCGDGDFSGLTLDSVVERWRYACKSEADSLAWRAFGGPQGDSWNRTGANGRACLLAAHAAGAVLMQGELAELDACLADPDCDPADTTAAEQRRSLAVDQINSACSVELARLIALDPATFVAHAAQQVPCLAAIAQEQPRFPLACGSSNALTELPRGEYQRVVLDSERFGTRCGDGSPYAFDIRLAPEGARLDRVVIGLQGGGVCFFSDDCSARFRSAPGLFTAADDQPPVTGIFSNDPNDSEFADWTKVYLPYCTQDVFIGGGVTQDFEAVDLNRYGAVNLRAALRVFRDMLWRAMDEEGGNGYRPDELIALFGGWSAGGYGTMYNYHWVLDDLLWQRTAAFPDAGLGFDNGGVGVRSLGGTLIPVWNAQSFLPPYCFGGRCAVGPENFKAISPRLKQVPEQQYLIVSNQRDETQSRDAFFDGNVSFINAMRAGYCETKDLNGIQWYLTSQSSASQHVVSVYPSFWEGAVTGTRMKDWFAEAIRNPDAVGDHAEEGDFTSVIPGVQAFPCEVAP